MEFLVFCCLFFFLGNPTVIAATPSLPIPEGPQGTSRPTLVAFISGSPAPTGENITWYFNNGDLPTDFLSDGRELVFPRNVLAEYAGIYTIQVTTSRGTATDRFEVIVTSEL